MAAYYTFEDLSGDSANQPKSDNPYQDVIESCNDDPTAIQARYNTHRTNRNAQQRDKLLAPDFPGVTVDEILAKLENPQKYPGYVDPRHCLVFWARPTRKVQQLIGRIQQELLVAVPHLWLMPPHGLHMTALEITHSRTAAEIDALVDHLRPTVQSICDFTLARRARLVKPLLSYDAQALALSYLPADGEPGAAAAAAGDRDPDDAYTYHHLRRDLFTQAGATGVTVASRYVIPSAHLTIGRFIQTGDLEDGEGRLSGEKVAMLVGVIEKINAWLRRDFWPPSTSGEADSRATTADGGEWVVGEERGLECRKGTLWYGSGGETVVVGKGF